MRIIRYGAAVVALVASMGWAVPRYSVMYGQSCVLCHNDPSGGGQRSLYGAQFFAYTDLPMKPLPLDQIAKVQPMLNDQIQIGFDARLLFYGSDTLKSSDPWKIWETQGKWNNTLMSMQGDLYLSFQLNQQWMFYLSKGLYAGFELYGMGHILPYNGYVKIGRYTPPYGLRLADHKAFIWKPSGLGPSQGIGWHENGLEIGFHPQQFTFALAVSNGTSDALAYQTNSQHKAITCRTDLRFAISIVNLWVGLTGRYSDVGAETERTGGAYGGLALGDFFLLGEFDHHESGSARDRRTFVEASYRVARGVLLKVEHDFYDPDLNFETGAENMYVAGAEIVPTGFLQLIPNIRIHDVEPGPDNPWKDYLEGEIQFHVFF